MVRLRASQKIANETLSEGFLSEPPLPYLTISDLPPAVRRLPLHAQEIFLKAFDSAWQSHAGAGDQEEIAFRIAWAAVKKRYRKVGGAWVAREALFEGD